jgi:hypothetical protein
MLGEPLAGTIGPVLVLSVCVMVVVAFCVVWVLSEVPLDVDALIFGAWPIPVESRAITPSRMITIIEPAAREYLKISIGTKRPVVLIECE